MCARSPLCTAQHVVGDSAGAGSVVLLSRVQSGQVRAQLCWCVVGVSEWGQGEAGRDFTLSPQATLHLSKVFRDQTRC